MTLTHLLLGTSTGQIHLHSLPNLQHIRTLSPLSHKGCPISHLSTMLKPVDLHGTVSLGSGQDDKWPVRTVGVLERMRVGRKERERHVVSAAVPEHEDIFNVLPQFTVSQEEFVGGGGADRVEKADGKDVGALEAEVARLKADLVKAKAMNDKMWEGIVGGVLKPKSSDRIIK